MQIIPPKSELYMFRDRQSNRYGLQMNWQLTLDMFDKVFNNQQRFPNDDTKLQYCCNNPVDDINESLRITEYRSLR